VAVDTALEELRHKTLETARRYKAAWIELGQYLFTIYRDKKFREWSYLSFETYCQKELHIKREVAAKLLKSYHFLETEEPRLAKRETFEDDEAPRAVPHYESVNLLRLAKENKNIEARDFGDLRHAVLEACKEPKEVRAQVKRILDEKADPDDEAAQRSKRNAAIKRLVTMLTNACEELRTDKVLPGYLLKQMNELAGKLRDQLE
jgi:hypothetical protein